MTHSPHSRGVQYPSQSWVDADQLAVSVLQQVRFSRLSIASPDPPFLAVSIPLPRFDIAGCLRAASIYPQAYWQGRDGSIEIAALGNLLDAAASSELSLTTLQSLIKQIHCNRLWAFYGQAFDPDRLSSPDLWSEFPRRAIQLPKITLGREAGEYFATFVFTLKAEDDELELVRGLLEMIGAMPASTDTESAEISTDVESRTDLPDRQEWNRAVERILMTIVSGTIQKAVLARLSRLRLDEDLSWTHLLKANCARHQDTYRFLFAPSAKAAFLGASPERLFRLDGDHVDTEAMAGTVARGANAVGDRLRDDELRSSLKDQDEHRYVIQGIIERLSSLTKNIEVSNEPAVVHLRHVAHLRSQISATLNSGVNLDQLLAAMHPTAAVCGLPTAEARHLLAQLEPFNRGWYSGPLGIIGEESCEFAVALRSALVSGKTVDLFAGAGIVRGSEPDLEWLELEQKLRAQLEILAGVKV